MINNIVVLWIIPSAQIYNEAVAHRVNLNQTPAQPANGTPLYFNWSRLKKNIDYYYILLLYNFIKTDIYTF